MPATNAGFSVRISAVDAATATLDKINKRIAAMSAPAERFNKSMAKFGDVSGITKLSEGMSSLGHNALDTFRSVERIVSPMAAITGAGSIAGMTPGDAGAEADQSRGRGQAGWFLRRST
jgi:hypothetical protein